MQAHFIFIFTQATTKKIKRACKPTHRDSANLTRQTLERKEAQQVTAPTSNWRGRGNRKFSIFKQPFVVIDSGVFQTPTTGSCKTLMAMLLNKSQ